MEGHRLLSRLLACVAVCAGLVASSAADAGAYPLPPYDHPVAEFSSVCFLGRVAGDDPIVFPAQPGASHTHLFFGNWGTNAFSTYASLRNEPTVPTPWGPTATSCVKRPQDTAAYWAPLAFSGGQPVWFAQAASYYKTGGKDPATIRAFPAGLKVVAGHPSGVVPRGERKRVVSWKCDRVYGVKPGPTVPDCPNGRLLLRIEFPDCWNGRSLDGARHRSHMAYAYERTRSRRRIMVCPSSHPVSVPQLSLDVLYGFRGGVQGAAVQLSSGAPVTAHADFFNAWDQPELERLVRECLKGHKLCGRQNDLGGRP